MHVVNRVVMPYSSTLPDLIAGQDNRLIFSHLLFTTNWKDSLQAIRDEEYEKRDLPDYDNSVIIFSMVLPGYSSAISLSTHIL